MMCRGREDGGNGGKSSAFFENISSANISSMDGGTGAAESETER